MTNTEVDNIRNGIIPMPSLFASTAGVGDIASIPDTEAGDGGVSFDKGYTSSYDGAEGAPKKIERDKFNWILRTLSQGTFFSQAGIRYTFNKSVSDKIGGYPEGAVLSLVENGSVRYVISLVDNNEWNFVTQGVDGIHWKYADAAGASGIFPDYGSKAIILQAAIPTGMNSAQQCSPWIMMPEDGWILMSYGMHSGISAFLVLGPASGETPENVNVSSTSESDKYTVFNLGEGYYGNEAIFPVKKGTMMSVYAINSSETSSVAMIVKYGLFQ